MACHATLHTLIPEGSLILCTVFWVLWVLGSGSWVPGSLGAPRPPSHTACLQLLPTDPGAVDQRGPDPDSPPLPTQANPGSADPPAHAHVLLTPWRHAPRSVAPSVPSATPTHPLLTPNSHSTQTLTAGAGRPLATLPHTPLTPLRLAPYAVAPSVSSAVATPNRKNWRKAASCRVGGGRRGVDAWRGGAEQKGGRACIHQEWP